MGEDGELTRFELAQKSAYPIRRKPNPKGVCRGCSLLDSIVARRFAPSSVLVYRPEGATNDLPRSVAPHSLRGGSMRRSVELRVPPLRGNESRLSALGLSSRSRFFAKYLGSHPLCARDSHLHHAVISPSRQRARRDAMWGV